MNDVAVQVQKADGTWVAAADYDEGWSKNAYEVRFSYTENGKTVEAQVTLTVADDSATQGGVSISANDFNVAAADLPAAADGAEALLKWLYEQAQAQAMVGGAPVTEAFCRRIGADAYTPDAATAAEIAVQLCS